MCDRNNNDMKDCLSRENTIPAVFQITEVVKYSHNFEVEKETSPVLKSQAAFT